MKLGLVYFVFGFSGVVGGEPVIGYYDYGLSRFVVDYSGMAETSDVKAKFLNGDIKLPVVMFSGVHSVYYSEVVDKEYVRKGCFCVDLLDYAMIDEEGKGYIVIEDCGRISVPLSLTAGYRWSDGQRSVDCAAYFRVGEFLGNIDIDVDVLIPGVGIEKVFV